MSITPVESFDFRTATGSTARTGKYGILTLTEKGSPSYGASGVTLSGAGTGLYATLTAGLKFSTAYTIMANLRSLGTPTQDVNAFGYLYDTSASSPYTCLAAGFTDQQYMYGSTNTGGSFVTTTPSFQLTTNTDYGITLLWNGSSTFTIKNGTTSIGSNSAASAPNFTASSILGIGDYPGVTRDPNERVAWLIIFDGALSDGEITTVQSNPDAYLGATPTAAFRPYYITG